MVGTRAHASNLGQGKGLPAATHTQHSKRRHMTPGQQAAIVASAQGWAQAQPASRPEKAGKTAGLSMDTVTASFLGNPETTSSTGAGLAAGVETVSTKRRHLDATQRSAVAAELANMAHGGDRKNQDANLQLEVTREEAATLLNVSPRSVATASNLGQAMCGGYVHRQQATPVKGLGWIKHKYPPRYPPLSCG